MTAARVKTEKKVWLRTAQTGTRKSATMNFTHRVGTNMPCAAGGGRVRVVESEYGTAFTRRDGLRPRLRPDVRFLAGTVTGRQSLNG